MGEADLVERLRVFARKRRRRGYRLVHRELQREGFTINHKRVYRLWKAAGLAVPPRKRRKRIRGTAAPRAVMATGPNSVWCFDFLEERTISGSRIRVFCVSDEFTRESLAIESGCSFRSERVCTVLEQLMNQRGVPHALRMDNGPEFIALALRGLCHRRGIDPCYIEPGKPWQNGFAESFNARLRDEYLDGELFFSVAHAQVQLNRWRQDWNNERLHSSLAYQTPGEFATGWLLQDDITKT
jgi:putative transposase